jgi:hypothetical protein
VLFLPLFTQVLGSHIDTFRKLWTAEYDVVLEGHRIIHGTPRPGSSKTSDKNSSSAGEGSNDPSPPTSHFALPDAVAATTAIRRYADIGLVVVCTPDPVHYYALFRYLYHAVPCCTMLYHAMPCHDMLLLCRVLPMILAYHTL